MKTVIGVSLLLSCSMLQANRLEKKINAITETNVLGTVGGKNPSHLKQNGVFVSGDFLYWQATEEHLIYSREISGVVAQNVAQASSVSSKIKDHDLHWEWNPGFRVGLGYLFGHFDQWDIYLNWTHFHNRAHGSTTNNDPSTITVIPNWTPTNLVTSVAKTSSNWHLMYNTIDFELGRDYFISKCITVRPHAGLRWVSIDQTLSAHSEPLPPNSSVVGASTQLASSFHGKCDFWGLGIRGGANLLWHFDKHWGAIGQFSAALVYGDFAIKEKTSEGEINSSFVAPTATNTSIRLKDKLHRVQANIQCLLGLHWETALFHDKHYLELSASFEFLDWFNQNKFIPLSGSQLPASDIVRASSTVTSEPFDGDLGLRGFTLSGCYHF